MVKGTKNTNEANGFRFQELVASEEVNDKEPLRPHDSSLTSHESPDQSSYTFYGICTETLLLALPLAVSRLSWTMMKTTDTALIGHTGTVNLSASAVADLYTQSTGVFFNSWVLTTFVSQAFGSSNKSLGGIWLHISLIVIGCISIPVIASWLLCGPVLRQFDVSKELIHPAAYYAMVLSIAIPPRLAIGQLSQYLMAQGIAKPLVKTGLFSMMVNLLLGLILVLGVGVPGWDGFGFWMSPVVTVTVEWLTFCIYIFWFCFKQGLHKKYGCWPEDGFQWSNITSSRLKEFWNMYYPAALAAASDWWRVSAIGVVAVTFRDHASLAVFNSSYRIAWMSLIVIASIGSAMGVLLGQELGRGNFIKAKYIVSCCLSMAFTIVILLASVFYAIPTKVAMIFSSDDEVIDLYQEVALPLTTMLISMNLSVLLERVLLSCGRTQTVLWTGIIGSWGAQVPAVLLSTKFYRDDLYGLFVGVTIGYSVLDIILFTVIYRTDWEFYSIEASRRSEVTLSVAADDSNVPENNASLPERIVDQNISPDMKGFCPHLPSTSRSMDAVSSMENCNDTVTTSNLFDSEEGSLW